MSGIKYATAMLAAGGVIGVAGAAQAYTTVNLNLSDDPSTTTDIYLAGSTTPQFAWGPKDGAGSQGELSSINGNFIDTDSGSKSPEFPAFNQVGLTANTTYDPSVDSVIFYEVSGYTGPTYVELQFASDGVGYIGYASFDPADDLASITYGVPEPASWALLLAGVGLTGGALRGARRRRQAIAA